MRRQGYRQPDGTYYDPRSCNPNNLNQSNRHANALKKTGGQFNDEMIVEGKFNGHPVSILLDSGSSISIIGGETMRQFGDQNEVEAATGGQQEKQPLYVASRDEAHS